MALFIFYYCWFEADVMAAVLVDKRFPQLGTELFFHANAAIFFYYYCSVPQHGHLAT